MSFFFDFADFALQRGSLLGSIFGDFPDFALKKGVEIEGPAAVGRLAD